MVDLELVRVGALFDINEARASAILAGGDIPITIEQSARTVIV